jgi:hypothetical protein
MPRKQTDAPSKNRTCARGFRKARAIQAKSLQTGCFFGQCCHRRPRRSCWRSDHRATHHLRHPQDHLGLVADDPPRSRRTLSVPTGFRPRQAHRRAGGRCAPAATTAGRGAQSLRRPPAADDEARVPRCPAEVVCPATTEAPSRSGAEGTCADARSDSCAHTEPCPRRR